MIFRIFIKKIGLIALIASVLISCQDKNEQADLIIENGKIYTVEEQTPWVDKVAIKDGKIIALGTAAEVDQFKGDQTEILDANGQFVMPGFIEGHGHFSSVGFSLIYLNLINAKSWEEIVHDVEEKVADAKPGEWIVGRGWHQEKWTEPTMPNVNGYPYHDALSAVSPDNPVLLTHASGHGVFANKKAMDDAGVSLETPDPKGGRIVRNSQGDAIGVFEERAMKILRDKHQEYLDGLSEEEKEAEWQLAIKKAQEECLRFGVTSFQDAGSKFYELERFEELAENGDLDMRLWVMVRHSHDEMKDKLQDYKKMRIGNQFYTCNAVKTEVDGALGSYGAWLLRPYDDKPGFVGQNTTEIEEVARIAELSKKEGFQMCVHAIGDRANQEVLDIMETHTDPTEDHRWRIEHAQHLAPKDIPRFGELGVVPAMQGVHCTSDSPFVVRRLGAQRAREGAYAWKSLAENGAIIGNGTDAPVESLDPIQSFYASVTRKRADNKIAFFPMQKMTREEAIKSYTWNNAYAAFEEDIKGSLKPGKVADLVILSNDLIHCDESEILDTEVLYTIVDGDIKYQKK